MGFRRRLDFLYMFAFAMGASVYSSVTCAEVNRSIENVHQTGIIRPFYVKKPPSDDKVTETDKEKFYCYDGAKGYSAVLDCQFFFQVKGLLAPATDNVNNGGHDHDYSGRPHSKGGKPLQLLGGAQPIGTYGAGGSTLQRGTGIILDIPEVSGRLEVVAAMVAPEDYVCIRDCYTADTARWEGIYDIIYEPRRDEPLVEMPPGFGDGSYVLRRDPDADSNHHDDVTFYGTGYAVQSLILLAQDLNLSTGRVLSINDMSLLRGGLLDIEGNWKPGHTFHRTGQNADLNRESDLLCGKDKVLQRLIDAKIPKPTARNGGRMESAMVCRPCGKKADCQYHLVIQSPFKREGT